MTKRRRRAFIALGVTASLALAGVIVWRVTTWHDFPGTAEGSMIEGDPSASPTRWWNHWYLAKWGWKNVTVFEVPEEATQAGYDVGYIPKDGGPKVEGNINYTRRFRMKIGHEDCRFFAIATDGKEIPLTVIARTTADDPAYADMPLH